jgi:5'-nucleotidase/UDP-sugar diphosphatase
MKFRSAIFFTLLLFSFSLHAQDNIKQVTILHWNDFHAHNQPQKGTKKNSETGTEDTYYYGGTGSMLGWVKKFRTDNTLVLNAGDDFQGTPISNFTRGRSQIELLNLFNLDAFVIGNHEFDYSDASLDSALQMANFDYLSANVYLKSKARLIGKPYVIKDINGVKFGIIGITAPDLRELSVPKNLTDVEMLNTDSVIQVGINELKSQKCNVIILLAHDGIDNDKKLADKFYGDVDIIVGAHSHTPLFKPVVENGVIIVQAGAYSKYLGKLDIKVNVDKDTVVGFFGRLFETNKDSAFDQEADTKVNEMVASIGPELKRVIGKLEVDWKSSYSEESALGQFETDAFRWKTGADIAMINGGGLRKSLLKGDITVSDIWEINPFGNDIDVINVNGKILKEMLNNNIKIKVDNAKEKKGSEMLSVSGITYSFDTSKTPGKYIVDVKVGSKAVEDNKTYSIAVNSFIYSQFKKFFGDIPDAPKDYKTTGLIDRDAIIEYVEKQKVIKQPLEKRITDLSKGK